MAKYRIVQGEQWIITRVDGNQRVGGYHSMGVDSLECAEEMVELDITRNQLGSSEVCIKRRYSRSIEIKTISGLSLVL